MCFSSSCVHINWCMHEKGMEAAYHWLLFSCIAPPMPTLEYCNITIDINQPVIINCSVSATPHPKFLWILKSNEKHLPVSSWNSTYADKRATSSLNHTFATADLSEYCRIHVICIATNPYGRSEHHYILSLNSTEYCFVIPSISPTPSVLSSNYVSPTKFATNTSTINYANDTSEIAIIGTIVGATTCLVLVIAILTVVVCLFKHKNK